VICCVKCFSLTGKEKCVGGFDLIWDDGPVFADSSFIEPGSSLSSNPLLNSYLGLFCSCSVLNINLYSLLSKALQLAYLHNLLCVHSNRVTHSFD